MSNKFRRRIQVALPPTTASTPRSFAELGLPQIGEFIRNICLGVAAIAVPIGGVGGYLMDGLQKTYTGTGLDRLFLASAGFVAALGMFIFCLVFWASIMALLGRSLRDIPIGWKSSMFSAFSGAVFALLGLFVIFYFWVFLSASDNLGAAIRVVSVQVQSPRLVEAAD